MDLENSSQEITADRCAAELMEAIHPIMQFIRTEMRNQQEPSLSVPQFRLLAFLNRHPGASLSEVAEHLGITKATASAMTERLVQRGLVDRSDDPQERRHIMLKLTLTGKDILQQMREVTRGKIAKLLNNLTTEQLAEVSVALRILEGLFGATYFD